MATCPLFPYMSFKKTQCSLSFIVINVIIIILTELQNKLSQLLLLLLLLLLLTANRLDAQLEALPKRK
jgi:predicted membrane protein